MRRSRRLQDAIGGHLRHHPRFRRAGEPQRQAEVLTEAEIRRLWEALDCLSPAMAGAFRMRLLKAQRGVEVLTMRWENLNGEWWQIPAEVSKNGQGHRVRLAPQALDLLDSLPPTTGHSPWFSPVPARRALGSLPFRGRLGEWLPQPSSTSFPTTFAERQPSS